MTDVASRVAISPNQVVVASEVEGPVSVGGPPLVNQGTPGSFEARYTLSTGAHVVSDILHANGVAPLGGAQEATACTALATGDIFVTNTGPVFAAKLSPNLVPLWGRLASANPGARPYDVAITAKDHVIIVGDLAVANVDLGAGPVGIGDSNGDGFADDGFLMMLLTDQAEICVAGGVCTSDGQCPFCSFCTNGQCQSLGW